MITSVPLLNACRLVADDGREAALVQLGTAERPYLWLVCPATATLYLRPEPDDLRDCSDGSCEHPDFHLAAANHWRMTLDARANARRLADAMLADLRQAPVRWHTEGTGVAVSCCASGTCVEPAARVDNSPSVG